MRIMLNAVLFALCCGTLATAQTAPAARPATTTCDGVVVIVRLSEIKPEGSIQKFMAAAAAHQAWYRAHGSMQNQIVTARISVEDPATHVYSFSDKQVIAYHINPPQTEIAHDDGYTAFTNLYKATSNIKESWITCMPKGLLSSAKM